MPYVISRYLVAKYFNYNINIVTIIKENVKLIHLRDYLKNPGFYI